MDRSKSSALLSIGMKSRKSTSCSLLFCICCGEGGGLETVLVCFGHFRSKHSASNISLFLFSGHFMSNILLFVQIYAQRLPGYVSLQTLTRLAL